jgi:hypothetical protein
MNTRATNKMNRLIERAEQAEAAARYISFEQEGDRLRHQQLVDWAQKLRKEAAELFTNP